jgi:peptide/nickel transport system permease protein
MNAGHVRPADGESRRGVRGVVPPAGTAGRVAFGGQAQLAPARGSRGRHAGAAPPSAGQAVAEQLPVAAGWLRRVVKVAGSSPLGSTAVAILVAMFAFCFLGPLVYHTDQVHVFFRLADLSPRAGHPLGTDGDGDDELGRLMVGGQASLEVGIAAGLLAAVLGSLWGAVAGYLGGVADAVMMRIVDAGISIPTIVVLLLIVSIFRPTQAVLVLVIAATSWLSTARLVRAEALALRTREYVQMVRVMGGASPRAVLRHIAPNALGTIAVNVTFQIGNAILILATLSYLGLGVQFPAVDWGNMINSAVQTISSGYWWQIVSPGVALMLVVVAFTMLGDALRDGLKSKTRGR